MGQDPRPVKRRNFMKLHGRPVNFVMLLLFSGLPLIQLLAYLFRLAYSLYP
jgi:hypothetical protein